MSDIWLHLAVREGWLNFLFHHLRIILANFQPTMEHFMHFPLIKPASAIQHLLSLLLNAQFAKACPTINKPVHNTFQRIALNGSSFINQNGNFNKFSKFRSTVYKNRGSRGQWFHNSRHVGKTTQAWSLVRNQFALFLNSCLIDKCFFARPFHPGASNKLFCTLNIWILSQNNPWSRLPLYFIALIVKKPIYSLMECKY